MNNIQLVVDAIMRAGKPLQEVEIALLTGLDVRVIRRAIENANAGGYLTRIPATYKVTPKGEGRVQVAKEGKRTAGRPRMRKEEEAKPVRKSLVESAIANQHPLAAAMGGWHA